VSSPVGFTSTAANPSVNPSVTTTYTVTKTNTASGCSDTDDVTVTVNKALPSGTATGGAISCTTGTFTLSASNISPAGATLTWYGPASAGGANGGKGPIITNLNVSTAGTYTLRITNPINGCYTDVTAVVTPAVNCVAFEGCTLGYWKNHTDRWCTNYITVPNYATYPTSTKQIKISPTTKYGDVFAQAPAELKNLTLLQVLNLGGGGIYNLARQSVAALLNICHPEVDYNSAYPTTLSLINAVNAAFKAGGTAPGTLASKLDTYNNAGCPLGGTPATTKAYDKSPTGDDLLAAGSGTELSAYPNPYTNKATIEFTLKEGGDYTLVLHDIRGAVVKRISAGKAESGKKYSFEIGNENMAEGIYLARLSTKKGNTVYRISLRR
ncbi:MAG: T9SS type A sorting domain-containing protein, partial [Adhaeribacter sp.]